MLNRIEVLKLEIYSFHGCNPEERKKGGPFTVDVEVDFDFIIKGRCEISFMGRESELLFNPNIDLTKISNSTYKTNTWLNPLKQKPWDFK